jgi:hypothetical protein
MVFDLGVLKYQKVANCTSYWVNFDSSLVMYVCYAKKVYKLTTHLALLSQKIILSIEQNAKKKILKSEFVSYITSNLWSPLTWFEIGVYTTYTG